MYFYCGFYHVIKCVLLKRKIVFSFLCVRVSLLLIRAVPQKWNSYLAAIHHWFILISLPHVFFVLPLLLSHI